MGNACPDHFIETDPGCETDLHREEVAGAMIALATRGPWTGPTAMDCGCILTIRHVSELAR